MIKTLRSDLLDTAVLGVMHALVAPMDVARPGQATRSPFFDLVDKGTAAGWDEIC